MAIYKNAIGVALDATIVDEDGNAKDVSSATTQEFRVKRPDGTIFFVDTSFITDGTNGQVRYVTVTDDLDQTGSWQYQPHVILPSEEFHSAPISFSVLDRLGD